MLKDVETEVLRYGAQPKRPRALHSTAFPKGPRYLPVAVIHNQQELHKQIVTTVTISTTT